MEYFKCSDFYSLNVYYILNDRKKELQIGPEFRKKQHELTLAHLDFRWKFLEKVLGKDRDWLERNYPVYTTECLDELLDNFHGIKILCHGDYYQYLIPVQFTELIDWCKSNKPLHSKEPKKFHITFLSGRTPSQYFLKSGREWVAKSEYYKDVYGKLEDLEKIEIK